MDDAVGKVVELTAEQRVPTWCGDMHSFSVGSSWTRRGNFVDGTRRDNPVGDVVGLATDVSRVTDGESRQGGDVDGAAGLAVGDTAGLAVGNTPGDAVGFAACVGGVSDRYDFPVRHHSPVRNRMVRVAPSTLPGVNPQSTLCHGILVS